MGLIDRTLALVGLERRSDASPLDPSWQALAPMTGYYAGLSARAAENLSTVLACTTSIATALAYVPALIYRRDGNGNRIEVAAHAARRAMARPALSEPDNVRAGALDRRVTIERATTIVDDYGEEISTWAPLATVSAQVVQQSGREFLAAEQMQAEVRVLFRLRWIEGVQETDRISYGDRLHNIQEVKELGRRDGLELMTVAAA